MPEGETGRVFVGNEMAFEGYTGGGGKDDYEGLLSSGDVGHFDDEGRLFIDGRDDEMIVSGGENVFPREVEDLLADHEAVKEVAVVGVDDDEYGQRLKAFVVRKDGKSLEHDEVKKYVKSNLAGYKVPRETEVMDELPRNSTGKVLKRELVERTRRTAATRRPTTQRSRTTTAARPKRATPRRPRPRRRGLALAPLLGGGDAELLVLDLALQLGQRAADVGADRRRRDPLGDVAGEPGAGDPVGEPELDLRPLRGRRRAAASARAGRPR